MFCSQCGVAIQPGQRYCAGCGRPLEGAPVAPPTWAPQSRVEGNLKLLAVFWIVISVFRLIPGLFLFTMFQVGTAGRHSILCAGDHPRNRLVFRRGRGRRIVRRMGLIQPSTVGANFHRRPRLYQPDRHSVRNRARDLYVVGAAARGRRSRISAAFAQRSRSVIRSVSVQSARW